MGSGRRGLRCGGSRDRGNNKTGKPIRRARAIAALKRLRVRVDFTCIVFDQPINTGMRSRSNITCTATDCAMSDHFHRHSGVGTVWLELNDQIPHYFQHQLPPVKINGLTESRLIHVLTSMIIRNFQSSPNFITSPWDSFNQHLRSLKRH